MTLARKISSGLLWILSGKICLSCACYLTWVARKKSKTLKRYQSTIFTLKTPYFDCFLSNYWFSFNWIVWSLFRIPYTQLRLLTPFLNLWVKAYIIPRHTSYAFIGWICQMKTLDLRNHKSKVDLKHNLLEVLKSNLSLPNRCSYWTPCIPSQLELEIIKMRRHKLTNLLLNPLITHTIKQIVTLCCISTVYFSLNCSASDASESNSPTDAIDLY